MSLNKWVLVNIICTIILYSTALSAEFFVDKNNLGGKCNDYAAGYQDSPWCTIGKANNALSPGDVVNIRAGIYDEVIHPEKSGLPERPIHYKSFPGEKVIVRGKVDSRQIVNIGGLNTDWKPKSYIIIDGLNIERWPIKYFDSDTYTLVIIYGEKSGHNIIRNCKIKGTDKSVVEMWDSGNGLRVGGIAISKSSNNIIENNIITNMTYCGLLIGNMPRPIHNIIRYNEIYNTIYDGINVGVENSNDTIMGLLIEGNIIHGSVISDGIQSNGCYGSNDLTCTGVSGVIIRNNIIYDNAENSIDLKGTRFWVIENNILYAALGNNNGGLKAMPDSGCTIPPCNNIQGGANIAKGGRRYSRDIIIRNNVIYDGNSGSVVWDGYVIYNNTILNNRRTYRGPNQEFCISDSCSRKPDFPGLYGPGEDAVIINNILGDNGFAISRWGSPKWYIDYNCYYWSRPESFKGVAHSLGRANWQGFTLNSWEKHLSLLAEVKGKDAHSFIVSDPKVLFKRVGSNPHGNDHQFDFSLAASSPAVGAGCPLTHAVQKGSGKGLNVTDARFFYDGYGVVGGDLIVVGRNKPVRIAQVDYSTNTLFLKEEISWNVGDPVGLSVNGITPDLGAKNPGLIAGPVLLKMN